MIVNIGTRRSKKLEDVDRNYYWINGAPLSTLKIKDFPMKTVMEISLNSDELDHIKQEISSNKEFENAINNPNTNSILMHHKLSYRMNAPPDNYFTTKF